MRIAIVGLGGVGGYFGGKLARHYRIDPNTEIIFVARGEHLRQIQQHGLQQITEAGNFTAIPYIATDHPETCGHFDLTLFCVKSYSLEQSAVQVKNNIDRNSVIIPLLNGVDNVRPLKAVFPEARVLSGCVYIGAHIVRPGVVRQAGGTCQLLFGPEDGNMEGLSEIETVLKNADIRALLTPDIRTAIWEKYLFVSALASATTYFGKPMGAFVEKSDARDFLEDLMREVATIGTAQGIAISEEMLQSALGKSALFPYETQTSMQMDYEAGGKTEIDMFTGYIVAKGKELGIATPLHNQVYAKLAQA